MTLVRCPEARSSDRLTVDRTDFGVTILTTSGASLTHSPSSQLTMSSVNTAAATCLSSSVLLSDITAGDMEVGLYDTRHGRTLSNIFQSRLSLATHHPWLSKTTLVLIVPNESQHQEPSLRQQIEHLFHCVSNGLSGPNDPPNELSDHYELCVHRSDDPTLSHTIFSALSTARVTSTASFATVVQRLHRLQLSDYPLPSETAAQLACHTAVARIQRTATAQLAAWKMRTLRGLPIDYFGAKATQLLHHSIHCFDRDTLLAAGVGGSAARRRTTTRAALLDKMQSRVRVLWEAQVAVLETATVARFQAQLVRTWNGVTDSGSYPHAKTLQAAQAYFEARLRDLEVDGLCGTQETVTDITNKLHVALEAFPESPAARLKVQQKIRAVVEKQRNPTERKVKFGMDVVTMIRPDGFGNFQGFVGYQLLGMWNLIVGVQNDADSPEVISQLGGVRPPFVRIQPKLKVDVEL